MKRFLALALICASVSACATKTTIHSLPPGARVYIDQRFIGETPVEFSDSSVFWTRRQLIFKKEGHPDTEIRLRKDQVRVGPLIGTVLIIVPVFWLLGYPDEVTYELLSTDQ